MSVVFGNSSGDLLADRRYEFAQGLAQRGDYLAAAELLDQAIEIAPAWPPLHFMRGEALRQTENVSYRQEAVAAFQLYRELDPADHMGAAVKLSLLGVMAAPDTLPVSYVQSLFDDYAPIFDSSLVEKLDYTTPQKMAQAIKRATNRPAFGHLLDLGCGTGLATAEVVLFCEHKTGVDISPIMIDVAHEKNIFDDLFIDTIENYLASNPDKRFDLVLCADVLVYIGVLEKIFQDCAQIMRGDALFAFSVQYLEEGTWILGDDHRYAHSERYIMSCLKQAGLDIVSLEKTVLRKDGGNDIEGLIVICRK